ncbi:zinc finger CCCH domain-containing protein [Candidatus Bathyarchaeota archaeon]|nr:zinc finger CCCH domain-containing protein [Candidatus Bathyarchaeota archaeon]
MGRANPFMRKKRQRCREFDSKGYCSRGLTCKFDHSIDFGAMQLPQLPAGGDAYEGMNPWPGSSEPAVETLANMFRV